MSNQCINLCSDAWEIVRQMCIQNDEYIAQDNENAAGKFVMYFHNFIISNYSPQQKAKKKNIVNLFLRTFQQTTRHILIDEAAFGIFDLKHCNVWLLLPQIIRSKLKSINNWSKQRLAFVFHNRKTKNLHRHNGFCVCSNNHQKAIVIYITFVKFI